jgi:hypothetical protein
MRETPDDREGTHDQMKFPSEDGTGYASRRERISSPKRGLCQPNPATSLPKITAVCATNELRLVVVADHEQVPFRLSQQPNQPELSSVHVLELVDAQVREPTLPPHPQCWV